MPFLNPAYILSVIIAISVHECAHAFTASRLGDPTADHAGRLTLNPLAHLDPLGAMMFLIVGFGWAKPVPVNPTYFRHPKRGMALTALAGPLSNLLLACLAFAGLLILGGMHGGSAFDLLSPAAGTATGMRLLRQILGTSLFVNLALMAFNLFPIAPLDGSNILRLFIPWQYEHKYEDIMRMGPFILIGLIISESFLPIRILSGWVYGIMGIVLSAFSSLAGFVGA